MLHRFGGKGCYVGKGNEKKFRVPSAPPYVWPVAIDPWYLSGAGGRWGGGGGSRTETEKTTPLCSPLTPKKSKKGKFRKW